MNEHKVHKSATKNKSVKQLMYTHSKGGLYTTRL